MEQSVSRLEPRVATRMHRNHFSVYSKTLTDASQRLQSVRDGYVSRQIGPAEKASATSYGVGWGCLPSSAWNSEWLQTYRFNIVNAIFNEKVLAGDDLSVLEEQEDWE